MKPKICFTALCLFAFFAPLSHAEFAAAHPPLQNRIASIYVSQDFLNEQLNTRAKSELLPEMKIEMDPDHRQFFLKGKIQVPTEEMRAVNLDPSLGAFRFQVAVKPSATPEGFLVLEFPLSETYFWAANSKHPDRERVIVPVQLLSLGLASARGYLSALSGDFSSFDRRTAKLKALIAALNRSLATEKNADAKEVLTDQRDALRLQMQALPLERKQLQAVSKQVASVLGFMGEKELNLNEGLGARRNALVLKVRLSQLVPYLKGAELGGVRILHDKKDAGGENYLTVDVTSDAKDALPAPNVTNPAAHAHLGLKVAPDLIMRLNQSLFESPAILDEEKKQLDTTVRDLKFDLRDDGLHVSGKYHTLLILNLGFDTVVDVASAGLDVFEVKLRALKVAGVNLAFLRKFVMRAMEKRLDSGLKGICDFEYAGRAEDSSYVLRVHVEPKALVPAFPNLHLVDVDVREREFLLKVGKGAT